MGDVDAQHAKSLRFLLTCWSSPSCTLEGSIHIFSIDRPPISLKIPCTHQDQNFFYPFVQANILNMHSIFLTVGLLPLTTLAAPQGTGDQTPQPGPGVPDNVFELYAYGEGFGGLSVFNWNGKHNAMQELSSADIVIRTCILRQCLACQ